MLRHPLSLPGGPLQADRRRLRLFFCHRGPLESKLSRPSMTKKPDDLRHPAYLLAVRGGFEPPVQLPVRQFSKLVVSATHPHFR